MYANIILYTLYHGAYVHGGTPAANGRAAASMVIGDAKSGSIAIVQLTM